MLDLAEKLKSMPATLGGQVYALVAGYPATFFARVNEDRFELPPDPKLDAFGSKGFALDWKLFYDIRVWGDSGEWHAWWEGEWHARPRVFGKLGDTLNDRQYPILGTRDEKETEDWVLRKETRGPAVWVPTDWSGGKDRAEKRPVLVVVPIIEPDKENGLYKVVDSVIRRGEWTEE